MTRQQIISRLREHLADKRFRRFDFEISEEGIRKDGAWWYVPITSRKEEISPFDYAPALNSIEESFESQGIKLLLVPAEAPL